MKFEFEFDDGLAREVMMIVDGQAVQVPAGHSASLGRPPTFLVAFATDGFWTELRTVDGSIHQDKIRFTSLPSGPLGWWHHLHGIGVPDSSRGSSVKVGVIDEALESQRSDSCISHVDNTARTPRGETPMTDHSKSVCSLLASRCGGGAGFEGIAPGADVVFFAAGSDKSEKLSASRIAQGIEELVEKHHCHLITTSAGGLPDLPGMQAAIRDARRQGTVCLFAAGNDGVCEYPAKYPECLAIGAVGRFGEAPSGTELHKRETDESDGVLEDPQTFVWIKGACGPDVDCLAAGVGPIWNINAEPAKTAVGTSFAAPIAAGCIANRLSNDPAYLAMPEDETRAAYVENMIKNQSVTMHLSGGGLAALHGLVTL